MSAPVAWARLLRLAKAGAEHGHWDVTDEHMVIRQGHNDAPHECGHPDCLLVRQPADLLLEACVPPQALLQAARGALADIANSTDMTLDLARRKAARIYQATEGGSR